MEEKIEISKSDLLAAYNKVGDEGKALLEGMYGKAVFMPKDITERVKTFEDAKEVLGECHCFVAEYNMMVTTGLISSMSPDIVAYFKLRIITAALNEGWEPQFTVGEYRYYPWFCLYTQKEIDEMDEEDRKDIHIVGGDADYGASCGVSYARSGIDFSASHASIGARLAFEKSEIAKYAGTQFLDIWADFVFRPVQKEEEK